MVIDERVNVHKTNLVVESLSALFFCAIVSVGHSVLRLNHILILHLILLTLLLLLLAAAGGSLLAVLAREVSSAKVVLFRLILLAYSP